MHDYPCQKLVCKGLDTMGPTLFSFVTLYAIETTRQKPSTVPALHDTDEFLRKLTK